MRPLNYLAFLVTCIVTFSACTKNSSNPEKQTRITAFSLDKSKYEIEYNSSGYPSIVHIETYESWPGPIPMIRSMKGKTEYKYSLNRISESSFAGRINEETDIKLNSTYKWEGGKLVQTVSDNGSTINWRTDHSGRITGLTPSSGNSADWQYDNNGNLIVPNNSTTSATFTYTNKRNPFANGNTGFLFINSSMSTANLSLLLSAYLPEKFTSYSKTISHFGETTYENEINSLYEYSYEFDANGLLLGYTLHTHFESRQNGTLMSMEDFKKPFPVKCIRL